MSGERIENITKTENTFAPAFINYYLLPIIKLNGYC